MNQNQNTKEEMFSSKEEVREFLKKLKKFRCGNWEEKKRVQDLIDKQRTNLADVEYLDLNR